MFGGSVAVPSDDTSHHLRNAVLSPLSDTRLLLFLEINTDLTVRRFIVEGLHIR